VSIILTGAVGLDPILVAHAEGDHFTRASNSLYKASDRLVNEMARTTVRERAPRQDNRRSALLDAAATHFADRGFHATSTRELAAAVGMLPGSIYYHFPSKNDLLVAVYDEGVRRIEAAVERAVDGVDDPWQRLEVACTAHLEALLDGGAYARVVVRVQPEDAGDAADDLIALRDRYEALFSGLIAALDLPDVSARRALRLLLLGALNWVQHWYRPGRDTPRTIVRRFMGLLARGETA
jgi:AcrR family transcriptional regulator